MVLASGSLLHKAKNHQPMTGSAGSRPAPTLQKPCSLLGHGGLAAGSFDTVEAGHALQRTGRRVPGRRQGAQGTPGCLTECLALRRLCRSPAPYRRWRCLLTVSSKWCIMALLCVPGDQFADHGLPRRPGFEAAANGVRAVGGGGGSTSRLATRLDCNDCASWRSTGGQGTQFGSRLTPDSCKGTPR